VAEAGTFQVDEFDAGGQGAARVGVVDEPAQAGDGSEDGLGVDVGGGHGGPRT
jgi:hypothetical protein